MKKLARHFTLIFVATILLAGTSVFGAVGTAFTYQGRLVENGVAGNGTYDFRFQLYPSAAGGSGLGNAVPKEDVRVTEGYFTVDLDFGPNVFSGDSRWLEVAVRPGTNTGNYTVLSPRQGINPTPYSLFSASVPWSGITGTPAGFADGVDNDTTYTAGTGLVLNGTVFSLAPDAISGSNIASNQVVKSLNNLRDDVALLEGDGIRIALTNAAIRIGVSNVWKTTGNTGTTSNHFLGTLDSQALDLRVNNERALRLEPSGGGPNIIAGGPDNVVTAGAFGAAIGGGSGNRVTDPHGNVGGGLGNQAGNADDNFFIGRYTTVSGGRNNTAAGEESTVGGGQSNIAGVELTTISGGGFNRAAGYASTIAGGGGYNNTLDRPVPNQILASGFWGAIGGGSDNIITNEYGTVAGGSNHRSGAQYSTVGGGFNNAALGDYSTVPGGQRNLALGFGSFAAGTRAKTLMRGAFIWADANLVPADFNAEADNEFAARATGGVRFVTAIDGNGAPTAGVRLASGGGSWSSLSDRNAKENFSDVNCREILERLAGIPVETWNYKTQTPSIRHIGVMAQDFAAAFSVGEDERRLNTVDVDGVTIAAIKGLYELVREKDADLEEKNKEIDGLKERLIALEKAVAVLSKQK